MKLDAHVRGAVHRKRFSGFPDPVRDGPSARIGAMKKPGASSTAGTRGNRLHVSVLSGFSADTAHNTSPPDSLAANSGPLFGSGVVA